MPKGDSRVAIGNRDTTSTLRWSDKTALRAQMFLGVSSEAFAQMVSFECRCQNWDCSVNVIVENVMISKGTIKLGSQCGADSDSHVT